MKSPPRSLSFLSVPISLTLFLTLFLFLPLSPSLFLPLFRHSLFLPLSLTQMSHSGRMDASHNPLQQQQHQGLHGSSHLAGTGAPIHPRNPSQNPRLHTESSFGLGGPGGPGEVPDPSLDVSQVGMCLLQSECLLASLFPMFLSSLYEFGAIIWNGQLAAAVTTFTPLPIRETVDIIPVLLQNTWCSVACITEHSYPAV